MYIHKNTVHNSVKLDLKSSFKLTWVTLIFFWVRNTNSQDTFKDELIAGNFHHHIHEVSSRSRNKKRTALEVYVESGRMCVTQLPENARRCQEHQDTSTRGDAKNTRTPSPVPQVLLLFFFILKNRKIPRTPGPQVQFHVPTSCFQIQEDLDTCCYIVLFAYHSKYCSTDWMWQKWWRWNHWQ